jgi:hypothetical protein
MRKSYAYLLTIGLVLCVVATTAVLWRPALTSKPPQRAFYYWKTQWSASPAVLRNLEENRIGRLYMRFFDVDWDDASRKPLPVSPLTFHAPLPDRVEVVPVVYLVNAVFLKTEYRDVEALADNVWTKVLRMAEEQHLSFNELQIDCDWSDSSRRNYFHFADLLARKLKAGRKIVSSTIRLHQVKYARRTGLPPVSRGMLMFYNFGRIEADSSRSSIFNEADASLYASYIAKYPMELDLVLPAFSWIVHSREGNVLGLLENLAEGEVAAFDGFHRLSVNRYSATRSFFFRGRYFKNGDLLLMETTTPEITRAAAALARRGAGRSKKYDTVALFDLDEKRLDSYGESEIESILGEF